MKYTVEMKNPKTGMIEVYKTVAATLDQLQRGLDVFHEGGYEILSCKAVTGEDDSVLCAKKIMVQPKNDNVIM